MAFKFVVLAALVAIAQAGLISSAPGIAYSAAPLTYSAGHAIHEAPVALAAAPVAKAVVAKTVDDEYDPNPQYSYSYDVHDSLTGDAKSQQETRNGDQVQGSYSVLEADGTRRIVEYTADDHNGFNAVVHKEPATVAVKTAPVAVAAAPVVKTVAAAPVATYASPALAYKSYAAPVLAYKSYAAPVATYAAAPAIYKSAHYAHEYY